MILLITLATVAVQAGAPTTHPVANTPAPMREWNVPWDNTRPRDPFVARDGRVWFVGQTGDYVGVLDTLSGEFKRFDLEPGTGPHNLVVDNVGTVWYAGNRAAHIGRLDPATGKITKYAMPDPAARDPHTLLLDRHHDRNGLIWFTVQGGNFVGRFDTKSGAVTLLKNPTPNARPYGIVQGPDGALYYDQFNTNKIGRIDPASMTIKEYALPAEDARPRRIAVTGDGVVWYGDYRRGYLGRLDPQTGAVEEWPSPSGAQSRPYAVASNGETVWMFETGVQPNKLVGFDPVLRQFFSVTDVPSGGGTVRHHYYDGRNRTLWFGTDAGTIGRAVLPPAPSSQKVSAR
jgi:virginiamycin B lyase